MNKKQFLELVQHLTESAAEIVRLKAENELFIKHLEKQQEEGK